MKIKMLQTCWLPGYGNAFTFHKGRTYSAHLATNQPRHLTGDGKISKVFVWKGQKQEASLLLSSYEFEVIEPRPEPKEIRSDKPAQAVKRKARFIDVTPTWEEIIRELIHVGAITFRSPADETNLTPQILMCARLADERNSFAKSLAKLIKAAEEENAESCRVLK